MPRLFVAIDPSEEVRNALKEVQGNLAGARWTPPRQFHLTLKFIGEVGAGCGEAVEAALGQVQAPPLALQISGLGVFPSRRRPRVLFARVEKTPALDALYRAVEVVLQDVGIPAEERTFRPHVTLARLRGARPEAVHTYRRRHEALALSFPADAFTLYESVLRREGAEHRVRKAFPLRQAAA